MKICELITHSAKSPRSIRDAHLRFVEHNPIEKLYGEFMTEIIHLMFQVWKL